MADVRVGMPFDAATVDAVAGRLRATKRFDSVEVRKRFASIDDPSQIALVIIVDEGPVKIVMTGDPDSPTRVARKRLPNMLILPILNREDGYGITYGARLTLPDPQWLGKRSRVTFPLTWGGTKQAAVDIEKRLEGGVIDRVTASASISRSQNLAYDQDDDRAAVSVRGEHEFARVLRVGASTGWQRASFEGVGDQFVQASADVVFDTRVDADPRPQCRVRPRVRWSISPSATANRRRPPRPADTPAIRAPRTATRSKDAATSASSASRCSRGACCARTRTGRSRRTCSRSSVA